MSKRKNLKAYVRLDKNRKPIPGSLIYRKDKPYGKFAPMLDPYGDICCTPTPPLPTSCAAEGLWINNIDFGNTEANGPSTQDIDCSIYKLGINSFGQHVVTKFSADGDVVWSKAYAPVEDFESWSDTLTIKVVGNNLYCMFGATNINYKCLLTVKLDKTTGAVISSVVTENIDAFNNFGQGVQGVTAGYIDDNGIGYFSGNINFSPPTIPGAPYPYGKINVVKYDCNTGVVLNYSTLTADPFTPTNASYTNNIFVDSSGNMYTMSTTNSIPPVAIYTKWDSSFNVLWSAYVDASAIYAGIYPTDMALDGNGNIITTDYDSKVVYKLNGATGAIDWALEFASTTGGLNPFLTNITLVPDGSIYFTGVGSPQFFYGGVTNNRTCFAVASMDPVDGSINWGYAFDLGATQDMWYSATNDISSASGDTILTGCTNPSGPFNFFKLAQGNFTYSAAPYGFSPATSLITNPLVLTSTALIDLQPVTLTWNASSYNYAEVGDYTGTITKTVITI